MVTMVGTLCACEKQSTGIVKMTGGKEQTADEKEKVSEQNADQTVENNDVVQLPKNEENSESGSENEDYPGEDVVEIVNLKGETTTVYKVADGRYMSRIVGIDLGTTTSERELKKIGEDFLQEEITGAVNVKSKYHSKT